MKPMVWILVALAIPATLAGKERPEFTAADAAFLKVDTFCVDTSNLLDNLGNRDLHDVTTFLNRNPEPNDKLGWKWVEQCAGADAVIHFDFSREQRGTQASYNTYRRGGGTEVIEFLRLLATVNDPSGKKLTEAKVEAEYSSGPRALAGIFATLAKQKKKLLKLQAAEPAP
jgi:hypothetical protein